MCKVSTCFKGSHVCYVHFILLFPVQSLFACFRDSHAHFTHSILLACAKPVHMFQRIHVLACAKPTCSHVSKDSCSCLCKVSLHVSETLMPTLRTPFYLPLQSLFKGFMFLPVQSLPVHMFQRIHVLACAKFLCMFQRLLCSIYTLYLSLSSIMCLTQSLRFFHLLATSPYQQHTVLSFQIGRHNCIHKLTVSRALLCYTLWTDLSQTHSSLH